jgi:hypothetical protein
MNLPMVDLEGNLFEVDKTFRRNWLEEAYKIYMGDESIAVKKQHVHAAMAVLVSFKSQTEKVQQFFDYAVRKAQGLEVPAEPPSLEGLLPDFGKKNGHAI